LAVVLANYAPYTPLLNYLLYALSLIHSGVIRAINWPFIYLFTISTIWGP